MMTPRNEIQGRDPIYQPPVWIIMVSFTLLLIFLIFIGWGLQHSQRGPIIVGQEAPDFSITTLDGQQFSKSSLAGKIVVINFWASWCLPCEDEAAFLESAWQYFKSSGDVVFLGVDYADTPRESEKFLQMNKVSYPNGIDMGTRMSKAFRIRGVPETFVLGRDGKIVFIKIGPFNSANELIALIERYD